MPDAPYPVLDKLHRTRPYTAIADAWSRPVGLACSGGVDSTALLLLATWALRKGRVAPFVVMNVDHRTRPETKSEQRWVRRLATQLEVPFTGLEVADSGGTATGSPEEVLRLARYDALQRAAAAVGVDAVVTAHTRDDQVETVLMRLISGSSALGAAGMERESEMPTKRGTLRVLRPLLGTSRRELVDVLTAAGVEPLHDPTNEDPAFRRNAIRHRVIPALRDVEPGFDAALMRTVELAARDAELADALAGAAYEANVAVEPEAIVVDREFARHGAPAVTSRVLRRAALTLAGEHGREVTYERIEAVRLAASGRTGAVIELPGGVVARVERDGLRFSKLPVTGEEGLAQ